MKVFSQLLLIDANALIHRAFHALPPLTTKNGAPIGAIYGLANIILKIITATNRPTHIAAAFDRPEPTFRKQEFAAYKAQRPKTPDALVSQIEEARLFFSHLKIRFFELPGFEADDIIGTLSLLFEDECRQTVILTGDQDALQLVKKDKVVVESPRAGLKETVIYDETAVKEKLSVRPKQVPDYKGLVGDSSDNLPGIPGIGPKTAVKLLKDFSNLESLYQNLKSSHPLRAKLLAGRETALLSKKLATIRRDLPLKTTLAELLFVPDWPETIKYFDSLGFKTITQRLSKFLSPPPTQESLI